MPVTQRVWEALELSLCRALASRSRFRAQVEFTIVNCNENKNILFGPNYDSAHLHEVVFEKGYTYKGYADIGMEYLGIPSPNLYIAAASIRYGYTTHYEKSPQSETRSRKAPDWVPFICLHGMFCIY